jgi:tyrosyl-tRNA synthetase
MREFVASSRAVLNILPQSCRCTPCSLKVEERIALVRSFAQEIVKEDELEALLLKKPNPVAYDGFEPSGRMHIAQGVMKAISVNKLAKCGVRFKFWCGSC